MSDDQRDLLRHTLATLGYRMSKAVRGAQPQFAAFQASDSSRTPVQILAHMGDLMAWGRSMADGSRKWSEATPLAWNDEVNRFFALLEAFESYLASDAPLQAKAEKLFQGPVADALQHCGQLTFLRRVSGDAVDFENYFKAEIVTGKVRYGV